ncbi:MAG: hypothetical protein K6G11_04735 [Lachnospiraceae bacterium]|nr:hypothetical protein [Lachnospiraceae bacterium]
MENGKISNPSLFAECARRIKASRRIAKMRELNKQVNWLFSQRINCFAVYPMESGKIPNSSPFAECARRIKARKSTGKWKNSESQSICGLR